MRKFQDTKGRDWALHLDVGTLKRVKHDLNVDLTEPLIGEPSLLQRINTDVMFLCDLLFVMVRPQAEAATVTDVQFGEAMDGPTLTAAQTALHGEMIDFFQSRYRHEVIRALERTQRVVELAAAEAEKRIAELDPQKFVDAAFSHVGTGGSILPKPLPAPV